MTPRVRHQLDEWVRISTIALASVLVPLYSLLTFRELKLFSGTDLSIAIGLNLLCASSFLVLGVLLVHRKLSAHWSNFAALFLGLLALTKNLSQIMITQDISYTTITLLVPICLAFVLLDRRLFTVAICITYFAWWFIAKELTVTPWLAVPYAIPAAAIAYGIHLANFKNRHLSAMLMIKLAESEQHFRQLAETVRETFWEVDIKTSRFIFVNAAFEDLTGYKPDDLIRDPNIFWSIIESEDKERIKVVIKEATQGSSIRMEHRLRHKDGTLKWISLDATVLFDEFGAPKRIVGLSYDITQTKHLQTELERLSTIDPLTNTNNRRVFEQALDREWKRMIRLKSSISLIMLDVDHFKAYNDAYGHPKGDHCLKLVAEHLITVVRRDTDVVARYGGEEFVVILPNTDRDHAFLLAEKIRSSIDNAQIDHKGSSKGNVTASLGVATVTCPTQLSIDSFIEMADQALYKSKQNGRNMVSIAAEDTSEQSSSS